MGITSLIIFLAIGALAGWLAGNIMKGKGFGAIIFLFIINLIKKG